MTVVIIARRFRVRYIIKTEINIHLQQRTLTNVGTRMHVRQMEKPFITSGGRQTCRRFAAISKRQIENIIS